jgi:nickel-type superoxide dismutase maturation protease
MEPPPSDRGRSVETYHRARQPVARLGATIALVSGVAWACLRWRPSRIEIEGASMAPTLAPGDWALVVTPRRFRAGDVVVVEHPGRPGYEMVKRIRATPGELVGERTLAADEFWVEGDLPAASTDSRHFGPIGRDELKAKVLLIYWPRDRRGRIRRRGDGRPAVAGIPPLG